MALAFAFRKLLFLSFALLLLLAGRAPVQAQGSDWSARYFIQTRYAVDDDSIWEYFRARGGVNTFGYPVSRTFTLRGYQMQVFQRHVLLTFGPYARPVNLLDPDYVPLTRLNGSTFPAHDPAVATAAPLPGTPNYSAAVQQHLNTTVPESYAGLPVRFRSHFLSAAPAGAPDPTLVALEIWGFPTSQPARDPNNHNFVYQRFQRGIMHYDASTNVTRGILLGDVFKSVLMGQQMPPDLAADMANSPFLGLYDPNAPNSLAREVPQIDPPVTRQNSNMSLAFVPDEQHGTVNQVQLFFVALEDAGRRGPLIGCNDSLVPVTVTIPPTTAPLRAAMDALLAVRSSYYGGTGLYNALHQSTLQVESVTIQNRQAIVRLTGQLVLGGVCDIPRVDAQLRSTATQFATVDTSAIYINGRPLEEWLDQR
jgi:hypothetical protein